MNKRLVITLIACAVIFGGVFGFKWFMGVQMNKHFNTMQPPAAAVSTTEAKRDNWALVLNAVGTVKAINGVQVTPEVSGVVKSIAFESSERVEEDEVLAQLNDKSDRATLRALQAKAAEAESGFSRASRLYQEGNMSESERDLAKSQMVQARANAEAQKELVEKKTIRAPFRGELGIRQIDIGQFVSPGTPVVTLQQLKPIYVNFSLPEDELTQLDTGLDVRAALSAYPDREFQGEVTAIEPGVDPETRNFNIQATFENEEEKMRPGMFARITIRLPQSEDVVVIPRTAISFNPYGNSVYVLKKKTSEDGEVVKKDNGDPQYIVKRRFVKTGRTRGTLTAVTEGLEPGETVATSGLLKLRNNARVEINNEVQPPEDADPNPDNS